MKTFTEKFGDKDQFVVTLEIEPGETQGWVNSPEGYCASLASLQGVGVLTNSRFEEMAVPMDVIDEITDWAEEKGY